MSKKIILFFFILYARGIILQAQYRDGLNPDLLRAAHWTVREGLSQGTNTDIIKDINGFLWIGSTHGLNRFDGEGTGLGLSLSYEIITKGHGGTIDINTKEGEYAEFIITLPITNNSKTT